MTKECSETVLSIFRPGLLFVEAVTVGEGIVLWVYRSPVVRDTDPVYRPVRDLLGAHSVSTLVSETVEDSRMLFGKAVRSCHLLARMAETA